MTIWILALVLLASLAGIGYSQGAIRVAFSLVGILIAALLSPVLARFAVPVIKAFGISHPLLLWLIAPVLVFIVILSIFKIAGFAVHRKVDVYYKYKAGELRTSLWERINARIGLCLGLVNALVYLVIISWVIYALGYWTVQMATSDSDPRLVRILNRLSWDLQKTEMTRVAAAVDKMPEIYYGMADLAGLIYQNSLVEARVARYPAFLTLGERPEFQSLAKDQAFMEMRLSREPIRKILANANIDQMIRNPEMVKLIWDTVTPDVKDLRAFLESGKSPKYDREPLHGRWYFSTSASMAAYRKERPNIPASKTQETRRWMAERFAKTMIVASPDHHIIIKDFPQLKPQAGSVAEVQTLQGQWKGGDGDYLLTFDNNNERTAHIDGFRLSLKGESVPVVFDKEE